MKKLDNELARLRERVIEMGNLTERMVLQVVDAIDASHVDTALDRIMPEEEQLDQMQLELDHEVVRMLAVYSPVAGDLRLVFCVSRINSELERIGDHAVNMCEALQLMASKTTARPLAAIRNMADVVSGMVSNALNAFAHNDIQKAQSTIASDDMVDAMNDQIIETLLSDEVVRQALTGKDIAASLAQMLMARSLERMADQATNISEEVIYLVKGDDVRHRALHPGQHSAPYTK